MIIRPLNPEDLNQVQMTIALAATILRDDTLELDRHG